MITILDTGRVGEMRQCEALARGLGLKWSVIDPWVMPERAPQLILSFGKALEPAMALRQRFHPVSLHVHLGRPRLVAPSKIDLVIVMPQDNYPPASNTLHLKLPLNSAFLSHHTGTRRTFKRSADDKTTLFLNGPTAHHVLNATACAQMLALSSRLAQGAGEALQVILSHRTPQDIADHMNALCAQSGVGIYRRPLDAVLAESSRLIVTADSASLLADALRSNLPTWLFPLTRRRTLNQMLFGLSMKAMPRLRDTLIRHGYVAGGTDFDRWHRALINDGLIRLLTPKTAQTPRWQPEQTLVDDDLSRCVHRIQGLLQTKTAANSLRRIA